MNQTVLNGLIKTSGVSFHAGNAATISRNYALNIYYQNHGKR
jgi:hypothetical protein